MDISLIDLISFFGFIALIIIISLYKSGKKEQSEAKVSKIVHERTELKLEEVRKGFGYVLHHIELVNNRFGKDYLKLELSQQEFIRIKRELENY